MIRASFDLAVLAIAVLTVWYESQLTLALIAAVPAAIFAYLALRRTREMDAKATQAAAAAEQTTSRKEVIEGLDSIIGRLEGEITRAYERIEKQDARIEKLEREIRELRNGR